MAKRKRRDDMDTTPSYMVFDAKRGYVWGPDHKAPGTIPYWNTGLPATWAFIDSTSSAGSTAAPKES